MGQVVNSVCLICDFLEELPKPTNKSTVMALVRRNGSALRRAPPSLRADKEVVMAAVRQDGRALLFAAAAMQADKEVVEIAVQQDGEALLDASELLQSDSNFILSLLDTCPAGTFEFIFIFNVAALSGKRCCCVFPSSTTEFKTPILERSAARLALDPQLVMERGKVYLVSDGTVTELANDDSFRELGMGQMHQLQLIVNPM
mmetsp:Transcript_20019/g.46606  ORF Transcript_20019/g.46606 Transcript_20019/m.46606 type:complete len:202 (-) Transcript_20019:34-639(-)